jgi:hypothetical protein
MTHERTVQKQRLPKTKSLINAVESEAPQNKDHERAKIIQSRRDPPNRYNNISKQNAGRSKDLFSLAGLGSCNIRQTHSIPKSDINLGDRLFEPDQTSKDPPTPTHIAENKSRFLEINSS